MECLIYSRIKTVGMSVKMVRHIIFLVLLYFQQKGDISVHFIGDTRMKKLNTVFRGKKKTTDVLSFPVFSDIDEDRGDRELGDIFISVPQIKRQAKNMRVAYKEELIRMLIHGILHLLGHNHVKKSEAKIMFDLQERLIARVL